MSRSGCTFRSANKTKCTRVDDRTRWLFSRRESTNRSNHIKDICSKARKILGLLYCRYYKYADESTLVQLYMSLVRPHREYAAPVWDPHLLKDIQLLEDTQKFACRMCNKSWNAGYDELLQMSHLPSLSDRRLYLRPRVCSVFKIIHKLCYFPPLFSVRESRSHINRPNLLKQPFARTNSYFSFVPRSVSQWNRLPVSVVSSLSLPVFKESLRQLL